MICQHCQTENPSSNKFCGQCGSNLPLLCPSCEAENPPGGKFCGQCGTSLSEQPPEAPPAPSEHPTPESEAERRQLTVMFCDLADSTALSEQLDPEDLGQVIGDYQKACAKEIEIYGGYIARYMGDGILVYFGYPVAHEDDPERAVRSSLAIIDAIKELSRRQGAEIELQVRLGIATGLVVAGDIIGEGAAEEHAVLGVTPNLAARLQGIAAPGSVVISDRTHKLTGGFFDYEDLGRHQLKGIKEPEQAWMVQGESGISNRFEASSESGLSDLVGREEEVALLVNRWSEATEGDGQVAMMSGEAGVGKSRIAKEFRDRIKSDHPAVIMLSCSPFHSNTAFYPLTNCLQSVLGITSTDPIETQTEKMEEFLDKLDLDVQEIAPLIAPITLSAGENPYPEPMGTPDQRKSMIFEALFKMMKAQSERSPVLMIAEDAHWIDPSTDEFLGLLIDQLRHFRLLLLVAARPEFAPGWAVHPHVTTLNLNRMSRTDCQRLIATVTGGKPLPEEIQRQIVAKTDGIPLFVEELTKTVLESELVSEKKSGYVLTGPLTAFAIPESLQDSLMARLDRLAPVKEIAQLAAVIGRSFSEKLLASVSHIDSAALKIALNELVEAELIFQSGMEPNIKFEFKHALVQDAAYESLLKSSRQRYHREIATSIEENFETETESEPEIVAHHFSEAGMAERAVPYWRKAGAMATRRWASAEAIGHLLKGLEVLTYWDDGEDKALAELSLLADLIASLRILDRYDDALGYLDRAQVIADKYDNAQAKALIHYQRGNIYFPLGNIDGCLEQHELSRQNAQKANSPQQEAQALSGLGDAYYMRGHMKTAHDHFSECVRVSNQHDLLSIASANLPMRGHTQLYLNRLEEGLKDSLDAADMAVSAKNMRAELIARGSSAGKILYDMGNLEAAKEQLEAAIAIAKKIGARRFEPINQDVLAKILTLEGKHEDARKMAEEAIATSRETGLKFAGPMTLGALAVVTDDPETRKNALIEGEEILQLGCVSHNYLWFYRDAIDACLGDEDWAGVEKYAAAAETYTKEEPLPWMDLLIRRGRALAAWGQSNHDPALQEELEDIRDAAKSVQFNAIVPLIDEALAT